MIIDTHLHLIYRNQLTYPWLGDIEALNKDASYDAYQLTARRIGISCALHMEVDVADECRDAETDMIRALMNEPDSLMCGVISSCRPESDTFASWLARQKERAEIKGLRRVLHVVPDDTSTSTLFRDNIKLLSNSNLTFDLCMLPRQSVQATELVDHCPDVQFILDHCGVPDIKNKAFKPWARHVKQLAERDNVMAKISGVMAYTHTDAWILDDIRPYVEGIIEAFGWDRVIWGSDSPVCTLGGNLETWVAATHALIKDCSPEEQSKLLHSNAAHLWKL